MTTRWISLLAALLTAVAPLAARAQALPCAEKVTERGATCDGCCAREQAGADLRTAALVERVHSACSCAEPAEPMETSPRAPAEGSIKSDAPRETGLGVAPAWPSGLRVERPVGRLATRGPGLRLPRCKLSLTHCSFRF